MNKAQLIEMLTNSLPPIEWDYHQYDDFCEATSSNIPYFQLIATVDKNISTPDSSVRLVATFHSSHDEIYCTRYSTLTIGDLQKMAEKYRLNYVLGYFTGTCETLLWE